MVIHLFLSCSLCCHLRWRGCATSHHARRSTESTALLTTGPETLDVKCVCNCRHSQAKRRDGWSPPHGWPPTFRTRLVCGAATTGKHSQNNHLVFVCVVCATVGSPARLARSSTRHGAPRPRECSLPQAMAAMAAYRAGLSVVELRLFAAYVCVPLSTTRQTRYIRYNEWKNLEFCASRENKRNAKA